MSCAILNQVAPPVRLYWIIRRSLCVRLVPAHLISWTLPINQTSPPLGSIMVSGGSGIGVGVGVGVGVGEAVGVGVGVGEAVGVGVGVGGCAQYLPPVFKELFPSDPPQTIIALPVQTAV